ncbi:FtsX-like permease family protein [candidate division KSB1 bacterium]|nr:FtsX-like permease family protein [candidate division KSB1 bacterium]NIR71770.1 FtsX-like permease family protein [candidate division KSB1 bacterium]NIS25752.1 FtsX-like permease family protein [candidate division KSB1 bacterium]NIT72621.1 FtsX-like permease family protein [candidate division KSB1 bacterium]NIU26442.1 FtsX-like permease family protein [candidate division KSB1 bacterium]
MFKNYLKTTVRNLLRFKTYSFINIAGLAVGLACCLLIVFYVQDEFSFDTFHQNSERIYRAIYHIKFGGKDVKIASTPARLGPLFTRTFPEIESFARYYGWGAISPVIVRYGDKKFLEEGFAYADSTFLSIFSYPLLVGDPDKALSRPNTIVLTETSARKLFGNENPLGEIIQIDNSRTCEVTGVMQDVPSNSHIQFDYLASFVSIRHWSTADEETWDSANFATYFLLGDERSIASLRDKIPAFLEQEFGEDASASGLFLQPLKDIRLHSQDIASDYALRSDVAYVYGFSAIAALILLVACTNYMNLATARSARRAKEVGVRKVAGAHRGYLMAQFLGESFLTAMIALLLAIGLVEFVLPSYNALIGKHLDTNYVNNFMTLSIIAAITLLVGFVAGSYPALVLSGFQPVSVLKGEQQRGIRGAQFRKILVIFQFAVSVFLIVGTVVVNNQLQYVRNKKLGFEKDQILVLPFGDRQLQQNREALKGALRQHSNVLNVSAVGAVPGKVRGGYLVQAEGLSQEEYPLMVGWIVDPDFIKTIELELAHGRDFTKSPAHTEAYDYILNESAVSKLGWKIEEALGETLNLHGRKGRVIGVVKDFHYASLHSAINPLVLFISPRDFQYLLVKVSPRDISATLDFLSDKWAEFAPHRPFEYQLLDQQFDALYRSEEQLQRFFSIFAALAILIACLGLFGLAAFTAEQRTKEVGIRKVLGASIPSILILLSKEFTRLVMVAIAVASPIAYLVMSNWLADFAYRVELKALTFVVAGTVALTIALATVSFQAIRAALSNPVDALRYE